MTTEKFRVGPSVYSKFVLNEYFRRYWWCYALPLIVSIALIELHTGFEAVTFAIVFLVYPMAMSLVYFSYCFAKEIYWSMLEKTMSLCPEGIRLDFEEFTKTIPWSDIKGIIAKHEFLAISLATRKFTYFIVPYDAFKSKDDLRETVLAIRNNGSLNKPNKHIEL